MRHREGVVADGAVGEEGADVGHEGEGAAVPESPAERCGDEDADDRVDGLRVGDPGDGDLGGGAVVGGAFFEGGQDAGDED